MECSTPGRGSFDEDGHLEDVVAVLVGDAVADLAEEAIVYGADQVLYHDDDRLGRFRHKSYTEICCHMCLDFQTEWRTYHEPHYTVFPATHNGRDLSALVQDELDSGRLGLLGPLHQRDGDIESRKDRRAGRIQAVRAGPVYTSLGRLPLRVLDDALYRQTPPGLPPAGRERLRRRLLPRGNGQHERRQPAEGQPRYIALRRVWYLCRRRRDDVGTPQWRERCRVRTRMTGASERFERSLD